MEDKQIALDLRLDISYDPLHDDYRVYFYAPAGNHKYHFAIAFHFDTLEEAEDCFEDIRLGIADKDKTLKTRRLL